MEFKKELNSNSIMISKIHMDIILAFYIYFESEYRKKKSIHYVKENFVDDVKNHLNKTFGIDYVNNLYNNDKEESNKEESNIIKQINKLITWYHIDNDSSETSFQNRFNDLDIYILEYNTTYDKLLESLNNLNKNNTALQNIYASYMKNVNNNVSNYIELSNKLNQVFQNKFIIQNNIISTKKNAIELYKLLNYKYVNITNNNRSIITEFYDVIKNFNTLNNNNSKLGSQLNNLVLTQGEIDSDLSDLNKLDKTIIPKNDNKLKNLNDNIDKENVDNFYNMDIHKEMNNMLDNADKNNINSKNELLEYIKPKSIDQDQKQKDNQIDRFKKIFGDFTNLYMNKINTLVNKYNLSDDQATIYKDNLQRYHNILLTKYQNEKIDLPEINNYIMNFHNYLKKDYTNYTYDFENEIINNLNDENVKDFQNDYNNKQQGGSYREYVINSYKNYLKTLKH